MKGGGVGLGRGWSVTPGGVKRIGKNHDFEIENRGIFDQGGRQQGLGGKIDLVFR